MLKDILHSLPLALSLLAFGCSGSTEVGEGSGGTAGAPAGGGGTSGSAGAAKGGSSNAGRSGAGGASGSAGSGTGARGGSGGSTGGGAGVGAEGGSGGAYDPCAGKACGASCTICAPNAKDCGETADVKACDANGQCHSGASNCGGAECKTANDCGQLDSCTQCADGTFACAFTDCVNGTCVSSFPSCPAECQVDGDCPKSLAPCELCPDGSSACPWSRCESGVCKAGIDSCTSDDPCQGKQCGDTCTACTGANCPDAPAVVMYCDASLNCQLNLPVCDGGCSTVDDCPPSGVCLMCSDNSCAPTTCVNGSCLRQCPKPSDDPCGGCDAGDVCILQVGGPPGGEHYLCTPQAPCGAAGACACIYNQGTCTYREASADQAGICVCDNGLE